MANGNKRYQIIHDFLTAPLMMGVANVYQICDLACGPDYTVPDHRQICHEITYVVEGEGEFTRDMQRYRIGKGNLFLVRQGEMHAIRSSRHHPLRYLCMGFTFNRNHSDFERFEPLVNFYENFTQPV
ncbi:MAG: AraC family ligand binding domain-containing protein, partial [Clostridia bacterium]|nr:AraC family ligand binding domain-containing protein [Clostridia bacterium]